MKTERSNKNVTEENKEATTDEQQYKQGPITPELMEKVYKERLELERQLESYHRRCTKKGRFFAAMVRLDQLESDDRLGGTSTLGSVIANPEEETPMATDKRLLDNACRHLCHIGKGYLVPVLRLINKNRNNREESIWELMMDDTTEQRTATSGTGLNSVTSGASRSRKRRKKRRKKKKREKVLKCL